MRERVSAAYGFHAQRRWINVGALIAFVCLSLGVGVAQEKAVAPAAAADSLQQGFVEPPNGARPRVWWHMMDGNITPEGIRLDLDWMKRAGLGGVTVFQGSIDTPQVVPHKLVYMSPEWKQAFDGALNESMAKGFEFAIASSPGWSETGGPWVTAPHAMKKLVWSVTRVPGGAHFAGDLAPIPETTGSFQNSEVNEDRRHKMAGNEPLPQFAAEAAVVAYRIPDADKTQAELKPAITSSGGAVDAAALSDGDVEKPALLLPRGAQKNPAFVLFDYGHPQTIRAITLATSDDTVRIFGFPESDSIMPFLESSEDGKAFQRIAYLPHSSIVQRTISFPAVTARYFRVSFPAASYTGGHTAHTITELVLHNGARTDEWERQAGFATTPDYYALRQAPVDATLVVPQNDVIDLTSKVDAKGHLDWTPPPGEWAIVRFGYSLLGITNHPAPAEATGLEVDKLNRDYVKEYLDHYLKTYADTVGPDKVGASGITHMLTDSAEVGPQNWTDNMLAEFRQRRGYSAVPWLPALTGVVIGSSSQTDAFLWDFRRTIAELFAQNHYGTIADGLHQRGMRYYGEALETHRPSLGDDMEMRSKTDIPMGAMWVLSKGPTPAHVADVRGAASVAHIYGQNLVGAESMTASAQDPPWTLAPGTLKRVADMELALGVNVFEIHESTHQPLTGPKTAPGLTLGKFGLWFNRNETWAEEAKPWIDYLARSSFLLQQGHFHADVGYFYGEEAPLTALFGDQPQKDAPTGCGFDFVGADALLHHLEMKDGRLTAKSGTGYRVLYLGGSSRHMTVAVLHRLDELVQQGLVLDGDAPVDTPSLGDDRKEFARLVQHLWGGTPNSSGYRSVGAGRVYTSRTAEQVMADLGTAPDFTYTKSTPDLKMMFLHRELQDGDIYFVDSRSDKPVSTDVTLRVAGRVPELWDPATGKISKASYQIHGATTTVSLQLDPFGTVFVLFRKKAEESHASYPPAKQTLLSTTDDLNSNWMVAFQPDRGAPPSAAFPRLTSWSESTDAGIRYFSGTATYTKTIDVPASWLATHKTIELDLGEVHEVATLKVNGKPVGTAWKSPFVIDLTGALHPGKNDLEIGVTNLWPNRLIGDAQPGAVKYTFTDFVPYKANDPLLPSGLLGPIRVFAVEQR